MKIALALNRALFRVGSKMSFITKARVEGHGKGHMLARLFQGRGVVIGLQPLWFLELPVLNATF